MRQWLGFESVEICQQPGLSAENTRTSLHRSRTSLRQCMSSQGHSNGIVT
jgi:RNA polymerase sigma-70 factor (ECF subfamily)